MTNKTTTVDNMKDVKAFILSKINQGKQKIEDFQEYYNENIVVDELNNLISTNVLKFDTTTQKYSFAVEPKGDKIILEGNLLLPVTIIRNENETIVARGYWYSFPPNFDVNRIIWNVALEPKTKSTLVNLIELTEQKIRKSKIQQLPEYEKLCNLIVPYNDKIKFEINTVGKDLTSITIIFIHKINISGNDAIGIEYRGFKVKSEIKTDELIYELTKNVDERDYENIKINKIFNFSDFIFSKNEIPYLINQKEIEFIRLNKVRGEFVIGYYSINQNGITKELNTEKYSQVNDGIDKIKEIFGMYANEYLETIDFTVT